MLRRRFARLPAAQSLALGVAFACTSLSSFSANLSVEFTNLTHGIHFTQVLVAAHPAENHLFQVGEKASTELQAMAEGGSIQGLITQAEALGSVVVDDPADGLLAPGASFMVDGLDTGDNMTLSLTAMLLPTNDGFVGLDAWSIPSEPGTYTVMLNAYDAGTEANNELVVEDSGAPGVLGIPANPGGNGGTNGTGVTTTEVHDMIHIHRGNLGDTMAEGGASDLDSRIHRWLNPVAKLVVTVQ